MKSLIFVLIAFVMAGCASCKFDLDPKARGYCKARVCGEKLCEKRGGLKNSNPAGGQCNDGTTFQRDILKGDCTLNIDELVL